MANSLEDLHCDEWFDGCIPSPTPSFLEALSDIVTNQEETRNDQTSSSFFSSLSNESYSSYSLQSIPNPSNEQSPEILVRSDCIEILAQPFIASRLRTLADNLKEKRMNTIKKKIDNSPFNGPAIRIPELDVKSAENQYYIGITIVTRINEKTKCRYFHPYLLRDINQEQYNDEKNNIVWYPVEDDNRSNRIYSFPNLRINKKTEKDLNNDVPLRLFSCEASDSNPMYDESLDSLSTRKLVQEYNLKTMQLAFMIGNKPSISNGIPVIFNSVPIIYSEDMTDSLEKKTIQNHESVQSIMKSTLPSSPCLIYKYAPRRGSTKGEDEMLIFYETPVNENKYGKLQIVFECSAYSIQWEASIDSMNINVKGQMVSLKIPFFPYQIEQCVPVSIILKQDKREVQSLTYFYVSPVQCENCEANITRYHDHIIRMNSRKRPKSSILLGDDENDALVPVFESKSHLPLSTSTQESTETLISSNSACQPLIKTQSTRTNETEQMMEKISNCVRSLFNDNDFKPFLRLCRPFIKSFPELLHTAISNDHSEILSKFIPVASVELLQKKTQTGENVLLHALRLNRIYVTKAILEQEKFDKLFDDVNNIKQNPFHILAMNPNVEEMCNLIIDYFLKKSIDISEKFDDIDDDDHTPLQLAVINNNISVTRSFLPYFNKIIHKTKDDSGDNLIHLAVRYGDLTMIKLLLDDEQLLKQGNQSNVTMTPRELAKSLKHSDMVEYFDKIYYATEIDVNHDLNND